MVKQFDVVLVALDPAIGSECSKTRPCVVISPTEMNTALRTVIVAPLTSTMRGWRFRPKVTGKHVSELALDQKRAIDKSRIVRSLGSVHEEEQVEVKRTLLALYS